MTIDNGTLIGCVTVIGGAIAVGGGWVISVEKRINGLKYLHRRVEKIGDDVSRVDRRTERMETLLTGRLPESAGL